MLPEIIPKRANGQSDRVSKRADAARACVVKRKRKCVTPSFRSAKHPMAMPPARKAAKPKTTDAWENLKKAFKGCYEESVWDHLAGTVRARCAAGEHGQMAVKVIDQRGNELLVVKSLKEAK